MGETSIFHLTNLRSICVPWGAIVMGLILAVIGIAHSDDSSKTANNSASERPEVPSFYVRTVTGPLAGKSICYVCRHGDRPVIIVLMRELGADTAKLLKELDQTVNNHRANGLRCFAVLLTESPQRDLGRLQTLAFDEKIEIPLALASETSTQGSSLEFSRDSSVSVITYESRRIVERFTFEPGTCDAVAREKVVAASKKLVAPLVLQK